jgi:flagellar operon protein
MSDQPFLYPNVSSVPSKSIGEADAKPRKKDDIGVPSEFDKVFDQTIGKPAVQPSNLNSIKAPLKFSAHASQRLKDRKINLDPSMMNKLSEAVDRAEAKGIDDTLVLTKDAALIVNVKNRTVVTALDTGSLSGNVFTNIDGAVIV